MSYIPGVSNRLLSLALLFVVVSHPVVYGITNTLLSPIVGPLSIGGAPTTVGLLVHGAVFAGVVKYIL
jgi:hypothetical protein